MVIDLRSVPENAEDPIVVKLAGSVILARLVDSNVELGITVVPSAKDTSVKLWQYLKLSDPMVVLKWTTLVKLSQSLNAWPPMDATLAGIVTLVNPLDLNARPPIAVTPFGRVS